MTGPRSRQTRSLRQRGLAGAGAVCATPSAGPRRSGRGAEVDPPAATGRDFVRARATSAYVDPGPGPTRAVVRRTFRLARHRPRVRGDRPFTPPANDSARDHPGGRGATLGLPATADVNASAPSGVRRWRTSRPPCSCSALTIASTSAGPAMRITAEDPSGTSPRSSSYKALRSRGPECSLIDPSGHAAGHHADREPRGPEQQSGRSPGYRTLGGLAPDEVPLVVRVHVMPGERPANDDSIALMVLDKGDLLCPRLARRLAQRVGVSTLGTTGVLEHHQREIQARRLHLNRRYR